MQYRPRWIDSIKPYIEQLRRLPKSQQLHLLKVMLSSDKIETSENKKHLNIISKSSSRIKTLDQLLEVAEVDHEMFHVHKYDINKWEVAAQIDGRMVTEELFQVKASLVRNKDLQTRKRILEDLHHDFINHSPKAIKRTFSDGDYMLEVNIFDLHFGKLCWNGETGEDYDTKIASKRFHQAIDDLITKSQHYKLKKILFPIGNDFFNSDGKENQTSNNTPQDEDLRWMKTFRNGRKLIVEGIEKLMQVADVEVVVVQGNHDFERSYYLGDSLEAWFRNNKNVTINNEATPRKYVQFGQNLIGLTHGNNEKTSDLPLLMASEKKKMWSDTKFHEWHLGHLHHKKQFQFQSVAEQKGCTIRFMRSLSGTDAWHNLKGYVQNIQSAESFIWHKTDGLVCHQFFNL
jgi:predicted phosphodiesterase